MLQRYQIGAKTEMFNSLKEAVIQLWIEIGWRRSKKQNVLNHYFLENLDLFLLWKEGDLTVSVSSNKNFAMSNLIHSLKFFYIFWLKFSISIVRPNFTLKLLFAWRDDISNLSIMKYRMTNIKQIKSKVVFT